MTFPVDGVLARAVLMQACGRVAGPSFEPKLATSPVSQYVLSGPEAFEVDGAGETVGGLTTTLARALFVGSATLVAVTVALVELVTVGAVNKPLLEIEPALADQVTDVFELFVTDAENCRVPEATRLVEAGDTEIPIANGGFTVTVA